MVIVVVVVVGFEKGSVLRVIGIGAATTDAPRHGSKARRTCSLTIMLNKRNGVDQEIL